MSRGVAGWFSISSVAEERARKLASVNCTSGCGATTRQIDFFACAIRHCAANAALKAGLRSRDLAVYPRQKMCPVSPRRWHAACVASSRPDLSHGSGPRRRGDAHNTDKTGRSIMIMSLSVFESRRLPGRTSARIGNGTMPPLADAATSPPDDRAAGATRA